MVNQQIFLPMIPDSAPIVINIAQYDYDAAGYAGRLYFNLVSNGTPYDMNGATAVFQGEKPDGTTFAYAGTVVNSSVVRVNVRQQMTAVAGRVICNLVLNNSEGQIGSFNVWLEVQESATSGSTPSQTDIPALVAQAKQYADDAQQSADDAASYTGHPAYIGANNNWFVYDTSTTSYVDSGVSALGEGIVSIVKTSTAGLVDTYTITYTGGGTTTFDVTNGAAPTITVTAQTDGLSSATPTVTVTSGGTLTNPTYDLAFSGLKGDTGATGSQGPTGPTGNGIASITKIGTSGLIDTYRITFTDTTYFDYNVTNGANGTGAGDMLQSQYDQTLAVYNAGGIAAYVASQIPAAISVVDNLNSTSSTSALSANQGHEINNPTITAAGSRTNIATGDTLSTIWGKIAKWFADLKALAFVDTDGPTSTKYLQGDGTWQTFPSIPAAQVNSDWNAVSGVAEILNKPTIPAAANNGQLKIQINGSNNYFTADQSGNTDISFIAPFWHKYGGTVEVATLTSSTTSVTFHGLVSTNAYDVYYQTADGTALTNVAWTTDPVALTMTVTLDAPTAAQVAGGNGFIQLLEISA